jgi:hypothetical protein
VTAYRVLHNYVRHVLVAVPGGLDDYVRHVFATASGELDVSVRLALYSYLLIPVSLNLRTWRISSFAEVVSSPD